MDDVDLTHLRRCAALAAEALAAGDEPFGSVLVDAAGRRLFEDRNRVGGGDPTRHPELAIALWAVENLTPDDRADTTTYTSGEHCPMCAAAHAWVGLGRIVYAVSAAQLTGWLREWDAGPVELFISSGKVGCRMDRKPVTVTTGGVRTPVTRSTVIHH